MKLLCELRRPFTLNEASRLRDVRLANAGRQQRQIGIGAAVERQVDDRRASDHLAAIAGVGLEHGGRGFDHDGFGDGAYVEAQVDALPRVDSQINGIRDRELEALLLGGDTIRADAQVGEGIVAGIIAGGGLPDAGSRVFYDDFGRR